MKNLRRNSSFRYRAQVWNKNRQYSVPRGLARDTVFVCAVFWIEWAWCSNLVEGIIPELQKEKAHVEKRKKALTERKPCGIITKLSNADGARQKGL